MTTFADYHCHQFSQKYGYTEADQAYVSAGMQYGIKYARFYDSKRELSAAIRAQTINEFDLGPISAFILSWFLRRLAVWIAEWCWNHIREMSDKEIAEWRSDQLDPDASPA